MRGSPLIKTLLVAAILGVAAIGLRALEQRSPRRPVASAPAPSSPPTQIEVPFYLTVSAAVGACVLESGGEVRPLQLRGHEVRGRLAVAAEHPVIFLRAERADGDAQRPLFAKLTLEPPGRPTWQRTFDGRGRIDAVWEPAVEP